MAEKIYKTEYEISSPFIIDQEQLKNLDYIVEQEWPNLLEYKKSTIQKVSIDSLNDRLKQGLYKEKSEADTKAELEKIEKQTSGSYRFKDEEVVLNLSFKDGNSIRLKSFSEAFKNRDIQDTKIVGFKLKVDCGEVTSDLYCEPRYSRMKLEVRPQDTRISNDLFLEFKRWMDNVKAPFWQRFVRKFDHFHWFIIFMTLLFSMMFGIGKVSPDWPKIKQAHELLQNGIKEDEYGVALEIILALQSDFGKPEAITVFSLWYKILIISGIITCILLSSIPKVVLDIGKDENKVRKWRSYLRFISITIPITIFSSFIWPYLQSLVKTFFSH